ncbi:MAG: type II toxin-antitoxin system VapC family toxin [Terriglobus sp.]
MIGLDTNIVLRYLLQDDVVQTARVNRLIDRLTPENPGYISIATTLEIVWVLRSLFKLTPNQIATHIEQLLAADTFKLQNEQQVFEAAFALKRGLGEFEDALISALNTWAGCTETVTFDQGTSRIPNIRVI